MCCLLPNPESLVQVMGEGETVGSQKRQKTGVESEVRTDEKVALDSPSGDVSLPILRCS